MRHLIKRRYKKEGYTFIKETIDCQKEYGIDFPPKYSRYDINIKCPSGHSDCISITIEESKNKKYKQKVIRIINKILKNF